MQALCHPFRMIRVLAQPYRGYRLTQPPANLWHPYRGVVNASCRIRILWLQLQEKADYKKSTIFRHSAAYFGREHFVNPEEREQ